MSNALKSPSLRACAAAALLAFAVLGNAYAVGEVDYPNRTEVVREMTKMRDAQMKKSAPLSRAQYLQMQGKLFDMASKDGKMTMPQLKGFMDDFAKVFGQ